MPHGQHFLQIPGPSPVPERVLRAIDRQVIDHRGPEFQKLGTEVLEAIKPVFGTTQPVIIFPSSGTGAWEAAIVNTLSPGDRVLMAETGQFATLWRKLAARFGIRGIPTLIAFEKGKVAKQHAGLVDLNFLRGLARTA